MNRREAMLRELNLYPMWQRRFEPALDGRAIDPVHPAPCEISVKPSGPPAGQMEAGVLAARDSYAEERHAVVTGTGMDNESHERLISELDWAQLKLKVRGCNSCKLRAGCTQTVLGVGGEKAEWLFVGEGPGADEDAQGEPFVGQAGKLLDNMLMAINLRRGENVYIANIVKCRPPNNRTPEADEIATCLPYLKRQIELIKPKLIVALGKTASSALLGKDEPLGSMRGKLHDFNGTPLVATYHPAYLLRSPLEKAKAWQDLCFAVRARHGEA